MIPNNQVEWITSTTLTSGQNLVLEVGAISSGVTIVDASQFNKLTWAIFSSHAGTFSVEGAVALAGTFDTLYTVGVLATVLCTPYSLPAPQNQLGYVVINRPFIRLRYVDTAVANHTTDRVYAKAWE